MSKKLVMIICILVTMVIGLTLVSAAGTNAQQGSQMPMMQGQGMNMDAKAMSDMMKTPDMQKKCVEYMKDPEMQKTMIGIMKQPEMQSAMKQMLQQDPSFHQMMLDLVNSVDMNMDHGVYDA